jgi:hypothetical protein
MTAAELDGMPNTGLDEAYRSERTRKSNLLLEGQLLEAQGQTDAADEKFAAAALIEEELAARCRELGLRERAWHHHRSAVGCWARAGNFYMAERLGHALLADPDLTDRLRRHVQATVDAIRAGRREVSERKLAAEAAEAMPV